METNYFQNTYDLAQINIRYKTEQIPLRCYPHRFRVD